MVIWVITVPWVIAGISLNNYENHSKDPNDYNDHYDPNDLKDQKDICKDPHDNCNDWS